MQQLHSSANPFALMLDPQAVFARIEHSGGLERLSRRVCRPLDKPLLGAAADNDGGGDDAGDGLHDNVAERSTEPDAQATAAAPDQ